MNEIPIGIKDLIRALMKSAVVCHFKSLVLLLYGTDLCQGRKWRRVPGTPGKTSTAKILPSFRSKDVIDLKHYIRTLLLYYIFVILCCINW